jgi:murein DD-endopeptidase MepM/ murein hydrolase activator NlpD
LRRSRQRFFNRIGHWGFTIMIVPKRGEVRRLAIPWLGVISIIAIIGIIGYFVAYYPVLQYKNSSKAQTIRALNAKNKSLKQENNQLVPSINRTKQLEPIVNEYKNEVNKTKNLINSIQRKSVVRLASRGSSTRVEPFRLPAPARSPAGDILLLSTLDQNTASLMTELTADLAAAKALNVKLVAYETKLDHTPNRWPTRGRLTSRFGYRSDPVKGYSAMHEGIDIGVRVGTTVYAAADGVVATAGWDGGYGRAIIITHGYGYTTLYGHNSMLLVKPGQHVKKGQPIARSGSSGKSTGPHVHFEIRINGRQVNPLSFLG